MNKNTDTCYFKGAMRFLVLILLLIISVAFVTSSAAVTADNHDCYDRLRNCKKLGSTGKCSSSPGFMVLNCPVTCGFCHLRDLKSRCNRDFLNVSNTPAYPPGGMDLMFADLVKRFETKYDVQVLSVDPWVVILEHFVSDAEINTLISMNSHKLQRSTQIAEDRLTTDEHGLVERVLSRGRTSRNSWCDGDCVMHPNVMHLTSKIEDVLGVKRANYEFFQVLNYRSGEFYHLHHDMDPADADLVAGPRILTFFLYLSDVHEGGETAFPFLNLSITPKKGRAILWPSVLSKDLDKQDTRTFHEAMSVTKGLKYAANVWIHKYDYYTPDQWACNGVSDPQMHHAKGITAKDLGVIIAVAVVVIFVLLQNFA